MVHMKVTLLGGTKLISVGISTPQRDRLLAMGYHASKKKKDYVSHEDRLLR